MSDRLRIAALVACLALAACASLVQRPLPPRVQVDGVSTIIGTAGDTRFRVRLNVTNPNAYDVAIRSIDATLLVEDQAIASATLADAVVLKAAADTKVDVEARPDFTALAAAFDRIMRRLAVRYEVTGHAVVQDSTRLTFAKRGELPITEFLGRFK